MLELSDLHRSILERYSRPIVHMRHQVRTNRFGLVFGAGLSNAFKIPTWGKLVRMLASDQKIQGQHVLDIVPPRTGLPYRTEMLFEHFKKLRYGQASVDEHHTRPLDFRIAAEWREIVRNHLFSNIEDTLGDHLDSHPYLKIYIPLIKRTHMTVTYNFDDFIEQSLLRSRSPEEEPTSRGFESVTDPWTQFRRPNAIIYHPNGVLPQNALETPSDRFVFSEASYAEQLMGIFSGDQAGLLNHFSKHTCLFIGLSLEDETLRNVLIRGARSSVGNFHYYIYYIGPGESLDEETCQAITLANFKVYNLVTLFLNDDEIRAIGELIDIDKCLTDTFCDFANQHNIPVRFRFYVTGPLGAGKSTTISQFRNLHVLDEWMEERPSVLAKDWNQLEATEKNDADKWVVKQFGMKNQILRNKREGIFIMDRGPLDPLSFTPDNEWSGKASYLLDELCPDQAQWEVEDGRVILLRGEGQELALRMVITHREDYTADKLKDMEARLMKAYGSDGVISFDTHGLTPSDVVRRVARIVHLDAYKPVCNLHKRLKHIQNGGLDAAN